MKKNKDTKEIYINCSIGNIKIALREEDIEVIKSTAIWMIITAIWTLFIIKNNIDISTFILTVSMVLRLIIYFKLIKLFNKMLS